MGYTLLPKLLSSGHLLRASAGQDQAREQRALAALLSIPRRTYLQEYDVLFRRVSLWLLDQGYTLSNYQPHQVLVQVCALFAPREKVRVMVGCRHALKYDREKPSAAGIATLTDLLLAFSCLATEERAEKMQKSLPDANRLH